MTIPGRYEIGIYVDRDFEQTFQFKNSAGGTIDLSTYSFAAELRPVYNSDILLTAFTVSGTLSSGIVNISLTDAQTLALSNSEDLDLSSTTTAVNAVWDLVATNSEGLRENYVMGTAVINGTVQRV